MKKFISNKFVLFFLGVLFVIAIWFICSLLFDKNGAIFPSPILTFSKFINLLGTMTADIVSDREQRLTISKALHYKDSVWETLDEHVDYYARNNK